MFQDFHLFSDVCCKCLIWMFQKHILLCCNGLHACFICLQTYVANISSKCFENRSNVSHVVIAPVAKDHLRFVHELPDQRRGPIMVSSNTGARPPGTTQSRGWCAQVREVEGARASEQEARRGVGSRMQV
jgi:hypothetical protein